MRTPAGKECRFYHEDFHRGRNVQECRLMKQNDESLAWQPGDCSKCVVPEILLANSNPALHLHLTAKSRRFGLGRVLEIDASCSKHHIDIENPYIGCPQCEAERPGLDLFRQALEDVKDDD